jgi:excisionase family DNA binding protein
MEIERFGERDVLLTFQEAAQLLRVSRATMYRLLTSGQLVGHRVGRAWRFYKTDIHLFIASHKDGYESRTK